MEYHKNHFYRVLNPDARMLNFIRNYIPNDRRYYEEGHWYVHASYVPATFQKNLPPKDSYATLHLTDTAPMEVVRAVYRVLVQKHHPDKGGDASSFMEIKNAYDDILEHYSSNQERETEGTS